MKKFIILIASSVLFLGTFGFVTAAVMPPAFFPPALTLNGDSIVTVEANSVYTDAGATATDNGVDISSYIVVSGLPDTSVEGTYIVTYNVTSPTTSLSAAPITRTVIITPPPAPIEMYECKKDGWTLYLDADGYALFKNQGDCVSFVATDGKNPPNGN